MKTATAISLALSLAAVPAWAQQRVPDPATLNSAINQNAIAAVDRSLDFDKTAPQPVVRMKPIIDDPRLARVGDSVYVDKRLMRSGRAQPEGEGIRVTPRDTR